MNANSSITLVKLWLEASGWESVEIESHDELRAQFRKNKGRLLRFMTRAALSQKTNVVMIMTPDCEDWETPPPGRAWSSIQDLVAASLSDTADDWRAVRIGRDLLFPHLAEAARREAHLRDVSRELELALPLADGLDATLPNYVHLTRTAGLRAPETRPLKAGKSLRRDFMRALIAAPAWTDEPFTLAAHAFLSHAGELQSDGRVDWCAPVMLRAEQIRALGFARALGEAVRHLFVSPPSQDLLVTLLTHGYLHLYIANVESLRVDADLDVNTSLVGDVLAACGERGRFTLVADREFVVHGPVLAARPEDDNYQLQTMGQRFEQDATLDLFVSPEASLADLARADASIEQVADSLADRVVSLAPSRVTKLEAVAILSEAALRAIEANGGAMRRPELPDCIRGIVTLERRRDPNVDFIEVAVMRAGIFHALPTGDIVFGSSAVRGWFAACKIAEGLRAVALSEKPDLLDAPLRRRGHQQWVQRLAVQRAGISDLSRIQLALTSLCQWHGFTSRASAGSKATLENLLGLVLAGLEACIPLHALGKSDPRRALHRLFRSTFPNGAHLTNLTLPQRAFINLNLEGWTFEDCDMRSAWFFGCSLEGVNFQNSFIGGAMFRNCAFGGSASFAGADVSGAKFENSEGLADSVKAGLEAGQDAQSTLLNSAWTAANVSGDDWEAGLIEKMQVFGCPAQEMSAIREGRDGLVFEKGSNSAAFEAQELACVWHTGVVQMEDGDGGRLVDIASAVRLIKGWPADATVAAMVRLRVAGKGWYIALDDAGVARAASAVAGAWSEVAGWPKLLNARDRPKVTILAPDEDLSAEHGDLIAFSGDLNGAHVAGIARLLGAKKGLKCETLFEVSRPGLTSTALAFAYASSTEQPAPDILIGWSDGALGALRYEAGVWRDVIVSMGDGRAIRALAHAPRENIVWKAGQGGHISGYRYLRNTASGEVPQLFRFHTALRDGVTIVRLNARDQMLIIGWDHELDPEGEAPEFLLCVLMSSFGRVLAVWPEPAEPLRATRAAGKRLAAVDREEVSVHGQVREELLQQLRALEPKDPKLIVNPWVPGMQINLQARVKQPPLAERYDDAAGPHYRTVTLRIDGPGGELVATQQEFSESQMQVTSSAGYLQVNAPVQFLRGQTAANAKLRIGYLPDGKDTIFVERDVAVEVDWDINPFVANGAWVVGEQFYGMAAPLAECLTYLLRSGHVVVRAQRRGGKTSFMNEAARLLMEGEAEKLVQSRQASTAGATPTAGRKRVSIVVSLEQVSKERPIEFAIEAELNALATKYDHERNLKGLADEFRKGVGLEERLVNLSNAIRQRGYASPFVMFIDEWGLSRQNELGVDVQIGGILPALGRAHMAVCVTSVPNDFRPPVGDAGLGMSEAYRYFNGWLDIGRLNNQDLQGLIRNPLQAQNFAISEEAVRLVTEMSSGAPDDANKIMHYAFADAKAKGQRDITVENVMCDRAEDALIEKYKLHQGYLLQLLSPEQQRRMLAWASQEPPAWENDGPEFRLPGIEDDHKDGFHFYNRAGYRKPRAMSAVDADEVQPGREGAFQLWIPRGMALCYRELAKERTGDTQS